MAPELQPAVPLLWDIGPRDPATGRLHEPQPVPESGAKATAAGQVQALQLPSPHDAAHDVSSLLTELQLLLLQQQLKARGGTHATGSAQADLLASLGLGSAAAGRRRVLAAGALSGASAATAAAAKQILELCEASLPFEPDCQFETAQCVTTAKALFGSFRSLSARGGGGGGGAASQLRDAASAAQQQLLEAGSATARRHLKRLVMLSVLPAGLPTAPAEGFLGSCGLVWDDPADLLSAAEAHHISLDGFMAASRYAAVSYEERFEQAVRGQDTAVLCPDDGGGRRTCRFMRRAAKGAHIHTARKVATQLEFSISESAYEEAALAGRKMHALLSDGIDTWAEWLARVEPTHTAARRRGVALQRPAQRVLPLYPPQGPDDDFDGAWGYGGEGSHALTTLLLIYRTGWRAVVLMYCSCGTLARQHQRTELPVSAGAPTSARTGCLECRPRG